MSLYEDLLDYKRNEINDFFKNVTLFDNQFDFTDFNRICQNEMYCTNNQNAIKTVKELKESIPDLSATCKKCGSYYVIPRNKSIKGLDVQLGIFLENIILDFLNNKLKIKALHADKKNKSYPDCMILNNDKGILAYFEVKYHGAPFIHAINKINRYCYEGSATLDLKKLTKQLEIIDSELDRPTFYLHWIDYPCLKGIFFETSEQVKDYLYKNGQEFNRQERAGDFKESNYEIIKKIGYTEKFYSPLLHMGTFEEFIDIINDLKKNGVNMQTF